MISPHRQRDLALAKRKVGYPVLASAEHKTVGELEALPTTLVSDETGDVLEVIVGLEMSELEKLVGEHLGPAAGKKK